MTFLANLLSLAGVTLIAVGLWLVHPAASLTAGGLLCVSFGVWIHRRSAKR